MAQAFGMPGNFIYRTQQIVSHVRGNRGAACRGLHRGPSENCFTYQVNVRGMAENPGLNEWATVRPVVDCAEFTVNVVATSRQARASKGPPEHLFVDYP